MDSVSLIPPGSNEDDVSKPVSGATLPGRSRSHDSQSESRYAHDDVSAPSHDALLPVDDALQLSEPSKRADSDL